MENNVKKARQAFEEKYGVTPEERGFLVTAEIADKVVFAKNESALDAFKTAEELRKKSLKEVILSSIIAMIVWAIYLYIWPDEKDIKVGFILVIGIYLMTVIGITSDGNYSRINDTWKNQWIFYDIKKQKIVEP